MFSYINKKITKKTIKQLSDIRVIGLIMFGVVVVLVSWSSLRVLQINYGLQKKEAELRQKNQNQKLTNENLKLKTAYFSTDEYLELTARRQFNKAAEGEKLYLIPEQVALGKTVDLPPSEDPIIVQEEKKPKYQKNFEDWTDFLLGRR